MQWRSDSPEATEQWARQLAARLQPGDVITLAAPLGGGKTTLGRGLAQGLGIAEEAVSSPTFVLWQIYEGRLRLHHFDAYRLHSASELEELGFDECLQGRDVVVVEWPEVARDYLPPDRLEISLSYGEDPDQRILELRPLGNWIERIKDFEYGR